MIAAIDPGRSKSGIAVLDDNSKIITKTIMPTDKIESYLIKLVNKYNIEEFVLGNGTFSEEIENIIINISDIPLQIIDEANTTTVAEELYRADKYNQFMKKLFKYIKWKPSEPLDDYAAVVLGRKHLKDKHD